MGEAGHGGPEVLREFIAEQLWFAAVNADLAIGHAQLGDDQALAHCVRRVTAYMSAVLPMLADLLEQFPQPPVRTTKAWTTEDPS